MKRLVQNVLKFSGLELRRVERKPFSLPPRSELPGKKSGGHVVEFVGLNAVGKTYLLEHCAARLAGSFISQSEFLSSYHLDATPDLTDPTLIDFFRQFIKLRLESELRDMESNANVRGQLLRIRNISEDLLKIIPIDAEFPVNILMDEGFSKHYPKALLGFAQSGHKGAMTALSRRSLVFVTADPATAEAQLRRRQEKQKVRSPYKKKYALLEGLTQGERIQYYSDMQSRYRDWVFALKPYTRGVLEVSRENDLENNIGTVLEFLRIRNSS